MHVPVRETRSANGESTALQQQLHVHVCLKHEEYTQQSCYTLFCYKTCSIEYTSPRQYTCTFKVCTSTYGCTDELPHVFLSLQLIRHESPTRLFHGLTHTLNTWQQVDHFRPTRQHASVNINANFYSLTLCVFKAAARGTCHRHR